MNNKLELKSCLYEEDNHILILKWNRPSRKNAIDANMYFDVIKALKYASSNDNIKIVVCIFIIIIYTNNIFKDHDWCWRILLKW